MEWWYGSKATPGDSLVVVWRLCVRLAGWTNCSSNYFWRLVLGAPFLPWCYHHHSISAVHDSRQNTFLHVLDNALNLSAGTGLYVQSFSIPHGLSSPSAFFFTKTSRNSNYWADGDRVNIWNAGTISLSVKLSAWEDFTEHSICVQTKQSVFAFRNVRVTDFPRECKYNPERS